MGWNIIQHIIINQRVYSIEINYSFNTHQTRPKLVPHLFLIEIEMRVEEWLHQTLRHRLPKRLLIINRSSFFIISSPFFINNQHQTYPFHFCIKQSTPSFLKRVLSPQNFSTFFTLSEFNITVLLLILDSNSLTHILYQTNNNCMQKTEQTPKEIQIEQTTGLKSIDTFEELNLNPDLLRGIYAFGFEKPSVIQQKGILPVVSRRDTIAQAQSGTGKTATFSIGALQIIDSKSPTCQAIILAPTRELALQINKVIFCFSQFIHINTRCCIGGTDPKEDRRAFQKGGIQVVVGTPGRIKDLITRGTLQTSHLKIVVLDEADEMLGRGFVDEIREIFATLPSDVQVCLFSATMPPEIVEMTDKFMKDPVKILVKNQQLTLDGIKQFYISLQEDSQKFGTLIQLYKNMVISQCIVFTNRKERVKELADRLTENKFVVSCISGDMEMADRVAVMKQFRSGSSRILISTDLLSRGIDIQQVNLIVNYDLPTETPKYIHRIGRSGRFGRKGVAINFVTPGDAQFLANLRQYYNTQIEELPLDISKIME